MVFFGNYPKYADGQFVEKIFPTLDRHTEEEINNRIRAKVKEGNKKGKLTRNGFPLGSPGYLFLQATILMAGAGEISNPHEISVVNFPDVDVRDDGSLVAYMSVEELKEDPQFYKNRMMRMMGSTMVEAMISAFACELAMKAICLTCKDEAVRDHNLLDLYNDLPENSRKRIEADFAGIRKVFEKGKQTFGAWRYFEVVVREKAMRAMIDMEQAHALGKAARVILDEAEIVGLSGAIGMNAKQNVRTVGEKRKYDYKFNANMTGGESPPRCSQD